MKTDFKGKSAKDLRSSLWHSETDRNIAMTIGALTAVVIWLHVEIC